MNNTTNCNCSPTDLMPFGECICGSNQPEVHQGMVSQLSDLQVSEMAKLTKQDFDEIFKNLEQQEICKRLPEAHKELWNNFMKPKIIL